MEARGQIFKNEVIEKARNVIKFQFRIASA